MLKQIKAPLVEPECKDPICEGGNEPLVPKEEVPTYPKYNQELNFLKFQEQ